MSAQNSRASDEALLLRWRAGDQRAGNQLFQRYFKPLFRFFCNKADEQQAVDLLQQTLMGCVQGRDLIREPGKFRAYLFQVAFNTLMRFLRERSRHIHESALEERSIADLGISPPERLAQKAEEHLLLKALRTLPVKDQILLELYFWENLKRREVARILELSDSAVAGRLRRALRHLKRAIAKLASSPELGYRTTANFEYWLAELRERSPDYPHRLDPAG